MVINNMQEMEEIVSKNKDLSWDGWNVVERKRSDKAQTSKNGVLVKGVWYIQKQFDLTREGWHLPNKYKG